MNGFSTRFFESNLGIRLHRPLSIRNSHDNRLQAVSNFSSWIQCLECQYFHIQWCQSRDNVKDPGIWIPKNLKFQLSLINWVPDRIWRAGNRATLRNRNFSLVICSCRIFSCNCSLFCCLFCFRWACVFVWALIYIWIWCFAWTFCQYHCKEPKLMSKRYYCMFLWNILRKKVSPKSNPEPGHFIGIPFPKTLMYFTLSFFVLGVTQFKDRSVIYFHQIDVDEIDQVC